MVAAPSTAWIALYLVACGGNNKARPADDAERTPSHGDARGVPGDTVSTSAGRKATDAAPPARGDLRVRVEWQDVPVAARRSPGRTACNTSRAPAVEPTTTWGIPDAFVIVEGAAGTETARVVLADCLLSPRIASGETLVVESALERPAKLAWSAWGTLSGAEITAGGDDTPHAIQLPIAGHAVSVPIPARAIYRLVADGETAWVIAGPARATDAAGQVTLEGLAVGPHAVTAWIPPRAGQPARITTATAVVVADDLVELVLAPGPSGP